MLQLAVFGPAREYNSDLNGWDMSSVTTLFGMFSGAKKFNVDLNSWSRTTLESSRQTALVCVRVC